MNFRHAKEIVVHLDKVETFYVNRLRQFYRNDAINGFEKLAKNIFGQFR